MEVPGQYRRATEQTQAYEVYAWAGDYPALHVYNPQSQLEIQSMQTELGWLHAEAMPRGSKPEEYASYVTAGMAQLERAEVAAAFAEGYQNPQDEIDLARYSLYDLRMELIFDAERRLEQTIASVREMGPGDVDVARLGLAVDVLLERSDEFALIPEAIRDYEFGERARELPREGRLSLRQLATLSVQEFVCNSHPQHFARNISQEKGRRPASALRTALPVIAEAERLRSFPADMQPPDAFDVHRARRLTTALDHMTPRSAPVLPKVTREVCRAAIDASELSRHEAARLYQKVGRDRD
ncbi:MAG TPA: hypothetical protein VJP80_07875 [Candidatus Saccharimonadales bacterium]|nr:hypothetical protein [Candidatus Saccharimonadales bacterium]